VPVELPLVCRPKRITMFSWGLFVFVIALGSTATAYAPTPVLWASHEVLAALGFGALFLCASYIFAPLELLYLLNALRPGPALIIDAAGLEDCRLKLRLPWDDISQAQIRANRGGWFAALALRTRDGAAKRTSWFASGGYRRRGDQIIILVQFLAPAPELAALLMVKLIEKAGGAVGGKPFWAQ
jgi:hypothetical protein